MLIDHCFQKYLFSLQDKKVTTKNVLKTLAERDVNYLGGIHCLIFFIILYYLISLVFFLPSPSLPVLHTHTHTHTHRHTHMRACPDPNNPRHSVRENKATVEWERWRASIFNGRVHVLAVAMGIQSYFLFPSQATSQHNCLARADIIK